MASEQTRKVVTILDLNEQRSEFNIGDRVCHEFFETGTITGYSGVVDGGIHVKFDSGAHLMMKETELKRTK